MAVAASRGSLDISTEGGGDPFLLGRGFNARDDGV